ncbi:MAG: MlaD family protein [Hydrotalea sp.]|nr:MlaD family protein [Hydrotalea sp.]
MKARHSSLEIILGAVLLVLAIFFATQLWRDKDSVFGNNYYILKASLDNATGLDAGTAVKMAGLKVGQVKSRTLNKQTYRADIQIEIRQGITVPKDSTLVVGSSGLLGAPEAKIEQGAAPEAMNAGDTFQKTTSQPSLEDMIGRAIFVLNAVGSGSGQPSSGQPNAKPKQ